MLVWYKCVTGSPNFSKNYLLNILLDSWYFREKRVGKNCNFFLKRGRIRQEGKHWTMQACMNDFLLTFLWAMFKVSHMSSDSSRIERSDCSTERDLYCDPLTTTLSSYGLLSSPRLVTTDLNPISSTSLLLS